LIVTSSGEDEETSIGIMLSDEDEDIDITIPLSPLLLLFIESDGIEITLS